MIYGFIYGFIGISKGQPANRLTQSTTVTPMDSTAKNIEGQEHLQDAASVPNLLRNSGLKKLFISWMGSTVGHGNRKQKTCGC